MSYLFCVACYLILFIQMNLKLITCLLPIGNVSIFQMSLLAFDCKKIHHNRTSAKICISIKTFVKLVSSCNKGQKSGKLKKIKINKSPRPGNQESFSIEFLVWKKPLFKRVCEYWGPK